MQEQEVVEGRTRWSCAPRTRALRRASFDGRSGTNMDILPLGEGQDENPKRKEAAR